MDQLVLRRLVVELDERLRGRRIEQVYALPKNDAVWVIGRRAEPRLWFSAEPDQPHLYLRDGAHPTPARPPGFAMAARNLLRGRRIAAVTWVPGDRIVELACAGEDAPRIVFELIPRRATAMVVDANGEVRAVWQPRRGRPGLGEPYVAPAGDQRPTLEDVDEQTWSELRGAADDNTRVRGLLRAVAGMSPLAAREIVCLVGAGADLEVAAGEQLQRAADAATAPRIYSPGPLDELDSLPRPRDFLIAPYALRHLEEHAGDEPLQVTLFASAAEAARVYYPLRASLAARETLHSALGTALDIGIARARRTLDAVKGDAEGAGDATQHRLWADLLLAYPGAERDGAVARVPDPYASGEEAGSVLHIITDPARSLIDNAQTYYRRARRAERSATRTAARRRRLESRIAALVGLHEQLAAARDVGECRRVARAARERGVRVATDRWMTPEASPSQGALVTSQENGATKSVTLRAATPEHSATKPAAGIDAYRSSDGFDILVGRNARANERLTHKLAAPHDFWLHAEGPGSHVVIRNPGRDDQPSDDALREAASLAAYFSHARGATKVNVRWTQARHVKKPRGAPTGQVVLRRGKTVLAQPMEPAELLGPIEQ